MELMEQVAKATGELRGRRDTHDLFDHDIRKVHFRKEHVPRTRMGAITCEERIGLEA